MSIKWNERYKDETFFYGELPNDFLKEAANHLSPHSKILCLAEGEGRNAVYLASLGHQVTAVDQSAVGLEKLHRLAMQKNVQINTIVADLKEYKIEENSWDAIVSIWCHLPSLLRTRVHAQVVNGLKKSGLYIIESYTPKQLEYKTGGPDNIDLLLTSELLKTELNGLSFLTLKELNRNIEEGIGHSGMSAVVEAIACKN